MESIRWRANTVVSGGQGKRTTWWSGLILLSMCGILLDACVVRPYEGSDVLMSPPPPYYYDYYYYPSVRVYYQYSTGTYYYPSGGVWLRSTVLPPRFLLDHRDRVIIRLNDDKPYMRESEHRQRYHPHSNYRPDARLNQSERDYNRRQHEQYPSDVEKHGKKRMPDGR